jgi:hypothetical protein
MLIPKAGRSHSRLYQSSERGETFTTWTTSFIAATAVKVCTLGTMAFLKRIYTMVEGHLTMKNEESMRRSKPNTVHLGGFGNRWTVPTRHYVILNGAQRSEESLFFQ